MANLITRQNTDIYSNAEIKIDVQLSDMEQVVIDDEVSLGWDSVTNGQKKEPRKFKVVELNYEFDLNHDVWKTAEFPTKDVLRLKGMKGYYFRKGDKKVGTREVVFWYGLDDNQVKQIPDKLHDYARKELATMLKQKLERVLQQGIVIEAKLNA